MSLISGLDAHLEALKTKVTKSRIAAVTALCVENVKSEASIVSNIVSHVQRSQPQQKLGVLYAIDAVSRQWMEKAAATGQDPTSASSQEGTFAGGVRRIRDILPTIMTDIIQSAPEDHKDKINKLIEIWERGNTFPVNMLNDFKALAQARSKPTPISEAQPLPQTVQAAPPVNSDAPLPTPPIQPMQNMHPAPLSAQTVPVNPTHDSVPAIAPTVPASLPMPPVGSGLSAEQLNALSSIIPAEAIADPVKLAHSIQVLQQLASMGIPTERWPQIMQIMNSQQPASAIPVQAQPSAIVPTPPVVIPAQAPAPGQVSAPAPAQPPQFAHPANLAMQVPQHNPAHGPMPIPIQHQAVTANRRSRSRSPIHHRTPDRGQEQNYRQRSPLRSNSELQGDMISIAEPKWTGHDPNLPPGHIKVLSRTLFVGGVNCSEEELRNIFMRYGMVQSAIVNREKRHAFVKMCNRADAVRAKMAMEDPADHVLADKVRKTKWGVGFGPRECNNYETGESVIPLDRLTEADLKWATSAEFGGTGGKELVSGMVMEEPDIEIGAGVSSKAISARRSTGNMYHPNDRDNRNDRNDRNHHNRRASPPRRNRNSTGSNMNDRRQHDHYNNQNNNNNSRLPPKPQQYGANQTGGLPAPVAAFNYGLPPMPLPLPAPTSTGFISTAAPNAAPGFGGGGQVQGQQDWMQQMMQMGMPQGMGGMNGFGGQNGGYGQR